MDTYELKERTKQRAEAVWTDLNPASCMGLDNPVAEIETLIDSVNTDSANTATSIIDDDIRIKEEQLDSTVQLGHDQLTNELAIVERKILTQRTVLAMQLVTNDYIISIDKYVISVKNLLADAKDYALEIEKKNIPLSLAKAELAEDKAEVRIAKIDMQIQLEELNRKFVDVEVLRAELDVAKADVRLVLAEVGISEAELAEVEARVELAMTDVERTTLLADIAMIYADIATRALSETKYNVEAAEIEAAFGRISTVLASALETLNAKQTQITEQTALQDALLGIANLLLAAMEAKADTRLDLAESNQGVLVHEATSLTQALNEEASIKDDRLEAQKSFEDARSDGSHQVDLTMVEAEGTTKYTDSKSIRSSVSRVITTAQIAQAISSG
jgi:hypothetical protein